MWKPTVLMVFLKKKHKNLYSDDDLMILILGNTYKHEIFVVYIVIGLIKWQLCFLSRLFFFKINK